MNAKSEWQTEMEAKDREYRSRKWCVAASDSPLNGVIQKHRTLLSACRSALAFLILGWKVRICQNDDYAKRIVTELKAQFKQS